MSLERVLCWLLGHRWGMVVRFTWDAPTRAHRNLSIDVCVCCGKRRTRGGES